MDVFESFIVLSILMGLFLFCLPTHPDTPLPEGGVLSDDTTVGVVWGYGNRVHTETSCVGLEYFIVGNFDDSVRKVYHMPFESGKMKTPLEFYIDGYGDCESMSHTIMCLCDYFNETCEFYASLYHNKHFGSGCSAPNCTVGHLGVQLKEGNGWIKLV